LLAKVPAARFARADEVARAVLFLASEDTAYMLGENLRLDAGLVSV
jgi:NAD(P)-dependent dehydrogenase (short-subunit alcohol dehydrogenase family)